MDNNLARRAPTFKTFVFYSISKLGQNRFVTKLSARFAKFFIFISDFHLFFRPLKEGSVQNTTIHDRLVEMQSN